MDIREINDEYSVSGQITVEDLDQIKALGFKSIVCNRPDEEEPGQPDFAEIEARAKELGLDIRHIPVGRMGLTPEGVTEMVDVRTLVEDSLRMNEGAFSRHGVTLVRDLQEVPLITVDKHKVLQILVNVIRNAKYACDESGSPEKRVTVRVRAVNGTLLIAVIDTGVGIPPENLQRIFNHGFTTRKGGHGFGLHSCALAAKDLGGSLQGESAGPGQGATFTLTLPLT